MSTLIAIHSCSADIVNGRHAAIRGTWLPEARKHADVRFFVGRESVVPLEDDEIKVDATEDSGNLIDKEAAMLNWAVGHGYDRILKTETDVYFNVRRLFESNYKCADVVGRLVGPELGKPYYESNLLSFFQGHATWYTWRAAALLANELRQTYETMRQQVIYTPGKMDPSLRAADLWSMQVLWKYREKGLITIEGDGNYAHGPISYHLQGDYEVKAKTPEWMREMHREHNGA